MPKKQIQKETFGLWLSRDEILGAELEKIGEGSTFTCRTHEDWEKEKTSMFPTTTELANLAAKLLKKGEKSTSAIDRALNFWWECKDLLDDREKIMGPPVWGGVKAPKDFQNLKFPIPVDKALAKIFPEKIKPVTRMQVYLSYMKICSDEPDKIISFDKTHGWREDKFTYFLNSLRAFDKYQTSRKNSENARRRPARK